MPSITDFLMMDDKNFVAMTWNTLWCDYSVTLIDPVWRWLNVIRKAQKNQLLVIAIDNVFSVNAEDGGGGDLNYLNKFNLKKKWAIVIYSPIVIYSHLFCNVFMK